MFLEISIMVDAKILGSGNRGNRVPFVPGSTNRLGVAVDLLFVIIEAHAVSRELSFDGQESVA